MTYRGPARPGARRTRPLAPAPSLAPIGHRGAPETSDDGGPGTGLTAYGCGPDEAVLFREVARRFGVMPAITDEPVSPANVELASGNRCVSVGHKARIHRPILLALRDTGVRYISTRSVGLDHIDVESAARLGITVENVAYSPDAVADYTLMLMLMAVRNVASILRRAQARDFRLDDARSQELRDLTVGVIGTGRIGTAVIDRLPGFGCRVLACDRCPKASVEYVPLDALLQQSDVVTLHTPLTADTLHLLDPRRIEQMRPGAFLINTGRGALVDTEALLAALESGHLGGAALDVVEGEEGVFYSDFSERSLERPLLLRLQQLPNVLVTPHTAYYTQHALSDTVHNTIINCLNFERAAEWVG